MQNGPVDRAKIVEPSFASVSINRQLTPVRIIENAPFYLEWDAMLCDIGRCLVVIPFEIAALRNYGSTVASCEVKRNARRRE
ncbi:MAG: hypothetical protein ACI8W8_003823 [Rhodothermales bacterium]